MAIIRIFLLANVLIFSTGCVTYDYYGEFKGKTTSGVERDALVTWQATSYPLIWEDSADVVEVKTRCNDRTLQYNDRFETDLLPANIVFFGMTGLDKMADGKPVRDKTVCGEITDGNKAEKVLDLSDNIEISVKCKPKELVKKRRQANGTVTETNVDYLAITTDTEPYKVKINKIFKYNIFEKVPSFPPPSQDPLCKTGG